MYSMQNYAQQNKRDTRGSSTEMREWNVQDRLKRSDRKMQDWKMSDKNCRVKNGGLT